MIPLLVLTSQYVDRGLAMTDIRGASDTACETAVVSSSQMALCERPEAARILSFSTVWYVGWVLISMYISQ
jgi:hypothetical protein